MSNAPRADQANTLTTGIGLSAPQSQFTIYLPMAANGSSTASATITPDSGGTLVSPDGRLRVEIPAGAVVSKTTIHFRQLPDQGVPRYQTADFFFELTAQDELGNLVSHFQRNISLTLDYSPTPGVDESRLALYYLSSTGWQSVPSTVYANMHQVVATVDHFTTFALLVSASLNWGVGNIVGLCRGTTIHHGPGLDSHTTVPENDWAVKVIGGPRSYGGDIWWDTSRRAAGDPSGGTGWVNQRQAEESCQESGGGGEGGGGGGGGGPRWAVGNLIGLCAGTEIRHGPRLAVHTVVPEDDWTVKIIGGPRTVDGKTWWDTSRREAGDPSGGTGWVDQAQEEQSCMGNGGGSGRVGPAPLTPEQRAALFNLILQLMQTGRGDPVTPSTGNFVQQFTDLQAPGLGGFAFVLQRTYNSQDTRDGLFGTGWSSALDMSLRLANDGSIDVLYSDGHGAYFMAQDDGYVQGQNGVFDSLTYSGSDFVLTTPSQTSYRFDAQGRLTSIRDRHGNTITLDRDGDGHITRLADSAGRAYTLTYAGEHIASISDTLGRTIRYGYSAAGDLTSVTDANGGVYQFEYADHRMIKLTDPEGILYLQNVYDAQGRVIEQIDASGVHSFFAYGSGETTFTDNLGHRTIDRYDALFRVTETEDALGQKEHFVYDANYNLTAYTDKRGDTWTFTYDGQGNLLTATDPLGHVTTYTYNATNDLTSITDPGGPGGAPRTTTFVYDGAGNLIRIERPDGTTLQATYDAHGQMLTLTDGNGHTTAYAYDAQGNVITVTDPLGHPTHYGYDAMGRQTSMTDANGYTVGLAYDGNDNIIRLTDPKGRAISFEYDRNNNLIRMEDRRGGATTYQYDQNLKLVAETDPEGHTTTYAYDAMYNRISMTDPRGNVTLYRYDVLYRLVEVEDALHSLTRFGYDPNGNVISITNALNQTTTFEYDALNRLVRQTDALSGVTTFEYDAASRLTRVTNPRGAITEYTYDLLDRLTLVRDALNGEWSIGYDAAGNVTSATDANGHTTTLRYDAADRLVERTDVGGHTVRFEYDGVGNPTLITDALGHSTRFAYDENDNLASMIDALGGVTELSYDEEDQRVSVTDPNGNITRLVYDLDGLLAQVIEAGGQVTTYAYDAAHNPVTMTNAKGNTWTYTYDALNRRVSATDPLGHATTYQYDPLSRLTHITDANNITTHYDYDALSRLVAVVQNEQPGGLSDYQTNVTTRYTYDAVGNLTAITDANGHTTTFTYDLLNRVTQETNPLGHVWQYGYDPVGNLTIRTDANGQSTHYTYDADDLLTAILYPDNTSVTFGYDAAHNQTSMTDSLGVTRSEYDALNRLTASTNHLGQRVNYGYDAAGNRTSLIYPDGRTLRYEYDVTNFVQRVIDPDGNVFTATHDATHNIVQLDYPNQTVAEFTIDAAERLTSVRNLQDDGDIISAFAYTLDSVGNRTRVGGEYGHDEPRTLNIDYTYDSLYRLIRSADTEGRSTEYVHDAVGNRLRMTAATKHGDSEHAHDSHASTTTYTYDAANELLSSLSIGADDDHEDDESKALVTLYDYDLNGNRIRRTTLDKPDDDKHNPFRQYTYDFENRLVRVQDFHGSDDDETHADQTRLTYDGYGRLFSRQRGHEDDEHKQVQYVYDGLDPIAEYLTGHDDDDPVADDDDHGPRYANYYRGLGRILSMFNSTGDDDDDDSDLSASSDDDGDEGHSQLSYYHYDGLGSVSAITKHRGQGARIYRYDDYGALLDHEGKPASGNFTIPHNHYTYTGQEWDQNIQLFHFYAREYDPETGTWLTQDPYRGRLAEPMTLQRYGYVANNPISYMDWHGFDRGKGTRVDSNWRPVLPSGRRFTWHGNWRDPRNWIPDRELTYRIPPGVNISKDCEYIVAGDAEPTPCGAPSNRVDQRPPRELPPSEGGGVELTFIVGTLGSPPQVRYYDSNDIDQSSKLDNLVIKPYGPEPSGIPASLVPPPGGYWKQVYYKYPSDHAFCPQGTLEALMICSTTTHYWGWNYILEVEGSYFGTVTFYQWDKHGNVIPYVIERQLVIYEPL